MGTFWIWLLTWVTISVALVIVLFAINFISEYKRLRKSNIPYPIFILKQRIFGVIFHHKHSRPIQLNGEKALIWWDIRWMASGETLARVERVLSEKGELILYLQTPIPIITDQKLNTEIHEVTFVPRRFDKTCYTHGSVKGKLFSSFQEDLNVSAEIIIYPRDLIGDA